MGEESRKVVVIGAGLAGLTAAVRCAELGLEVSVLEQGTGRYACNSRTSGGILHVSYNDAAGEEADLKAAMTAALGPEADPSLMAGIAARAGPAIQWLTARGTSFVKASAIPWHRWTLAPPRPLRPGFDYPGTGADLLLGRLTAELERLGGKIRTGARAITVQRDRNAFQLIIAADGREEALSTQTLIIADGGFQGDPESVRRHITKRVDRTVQRGTGTGSGFALAAAESLGCSLTRLDRFYGHLVSRKALTDPDLNPYPQIDPVAAAGIVVEPNGRRFADEGRGGIFIANALTKLDDPASTFAIVDAAIWESVSERALYPVAPYLEKKSGAVFQAGTLRELATACGIDASALEETVVDYNREAESGQPSHVPRTGAATPIRQPPFIAVPLAPGITNTMGGIAVDADARALDREGKPIPGLYAVGASAGGLEGGDRVGYVGGLIKSITSGLAAAEHIAGANAKGRTPVEYNGHILPAPLTPLPSARKRPVILPLLVKHGTPFAVLTGIVVAAPAGFLGWTIAGPAGLLAAAVVGLLGFALAKALAEIAAIILDLLAPI